MAAEGSREAGSFTERERESRASREENQGIKPEREAKLAECAAFRMIITRWLK